MSTPALSADPPGARPHRATQGSGSRPAGQRKTPPRPSAILAALGCGLLALLLYGSTALPGVAWQDSGLHQYRILTGMLENPLGLALSHPLHYWLGRAAIKLGFGEPAYRLNLLSAFCGALGVGMLAGVVTAYTRCLFAGFIAALTLLFAHSYWQMSVITESYTLAAALMTIEWALLLAYARDERPWLLAILFAVNGLHVADHMLGTLTLATYLLLACERALRGRLKPRWLAVFALAWSVGACPYLLLILEHYQRTGNLTETLFSAFFGGGTTGEGYVNNVLNLTLSTTLLINSALIFGYNFPSLVPLGAIAGMFHTPKKGSNLFRTVLFGQTILIGVFVLRYSIPDQYTFYVPLCALTAFWMGLTTANLLDRIRGIPLRRWWMLGLLAHACWPLAVYANVPEIAERYGWFSGRMRDLPFRDETRHFLQPWKFDERSADLFAHEALRRAGAGGWVLADTTTAYLLAYVYRVHDGPLDIRIYSGNQCINQPHLPALTTVQLRQHLETGQTVLVVPSRAAERFAEEGLTLDRDISFWHLRLAPEAP